RWRRGEVSRAGRIPPLRMVVWPVANRQTPATALPAMRRGRIYPARGVYGVGGFACGQCPPLHFGGFRVLRFGFRRLFRVILAEQPGKGFELAFAVEVNPQAAFAVLVFDAHLAAGN